MLKNTFRKAKNGILIENLPSRVDIASHIGVHRSNVTRYISNLEKDGIFEKVGKKLLVKEQKADISSVCPVYLLSSIVPKIVLGGLF